MLAAHPVAIAVGLYAVVAIAAAVAAYMAIFTQFAAYDDEGTLLVSLHAFAQGDVLYRDIYSPYGPFYYELFGGLFALTGWTVSTDASRLIVIVVWITTSVLFGVSSQRLTSRLALGVAGTIVAFGVLGVLVNEPMHPHGLAVLLLGCLTLLIASEPARRISLAGAGAGALLALLTLTKVNLGALAIAAVVLAAVLTVEPLHRRRWLRWLAIMAFFAMPVVLMGRDLQDVWVRDFILFEFLGAAAIVAAAWPARPRNGEGDALLSRWLLSAAVGFALAFLAVLGGILLTGPAPLDVFDGVITQGTRIRDVFTIPFALPPAAMDWGIAAVAGAVLTAWLASRDTGAPTVWPGLLRIATGLTIWFTVAQAAPFSLNPPANQVTLPIALAWVAAIPPHRMREVSYRRFVRVLLPALAVTETLQAYPVAGSQVRIAALMFVPVGALCLADGLKALREWSIARGPGALERFGIAVTVAIVAVAGKFAFDEIVRPAMTNAVAYRNQQALPFPGTGLMHLASPQADEYKRLVQLLHDRGCTTFVGYPNVNSLYLWSSIDPPKPSAPGAWVAVLEDGEQQRVVDEMSASPRPCAIRNDSLAGGWLQGAPPPGTPIVRYVFSEFKPVARVGDFQFLVPKHRN